MIEILKAIGDYGVPLVSLVVLGFVVKRLYIDNEKKEERYQAKLDQQNGVIIKAALESIKSSDLLQQHNIQLASEIERIFNMWKDCKNCKEDTVNGMKKQCEVFLSKIDDFYATTRADNANLWGANTDMDAQVQAAMTDVAEAIETLSRNEELFIERFGDMNEQIRNLVMRMDIIIQGRQG